MLEDNSFTNAWKKLNSFCRPATEIESIEIIPDNKETYNKCLEVLSTFLSKEILPHL